MLLTLLELGAEVRERRGCERRRARDGCRERVWHRAVGASHAVAKLLQIRPAVGSHAPPKEPRQKTGGPIAQQLTSLKPFLERQAVGSKLLRKRLLKDVRNSAWLSKPVVDGLFQFRKTHCRPRASLTHVLRIPNDASQVRPRPVAAVRGCGARPG